jgi:class 3 adenylate cyclase
LAPKTQYAKKGEISIAYQVVGDGAIDLILVNGIMAHMDLVWAEPKGSAMLRQLASFSRLILFDKPGTGLSDPVVGAASLEQRVGDISAVMDAVDSERAALIGYSEGAAPSLVFAATYPERTAAVILLGTTAKWYPAPDFFGDLPSFQRFWRVIDEVAYNRWGEGELMLELAPSWVSSEVHNRTAGITERACASPGMVRAMYDALRGYDIRAVLPSVGVPTLVLHRREEFVPVELGRDLAERLPDARYVELSGSDHVFFAGDWKPIAREIELFLTGQRHEPETDRVLQTVLFTDIVGSTTHAAEVGDERWHELLRRHDQIVHDALRQFRGRAVKHLGDGFLAAFDGPTRAVRCARAICEEVRALGLEVRAGIHTGECESRDEDLHGLAVHIGSRIGALAEASEVLVSGTVCDLVVGSGIEFAERGAHELKGVPGHWHLYAVADDNPKDARPVRTASHEAAALTPGPREVMRPIDHAAVTLAKYAPSISRLGFRLGRSWRSENEDRVRST